MVSADWFKKGLYYFDQTLCYKSFQWYNPFSIPWHLSLHCFPKVRTVMRIIYYGIIGYGQKRSGKWYMGWSIRTNMNITITKIRVCVIFSVHCIITNNMWFPSLLLLPSWTSSWIFYNAENNNMLVKISKSNRCWKLSEKFLSAILISGWISL